MKVRGPDGKVWIMDKPSLTQVEVDRILCEAVENGFESHILSWTPEELAHNLASFDEAAEDVPVEVIVPLVKSWQERNRKRS